ncbi:U32 family peptidase [Eubacteriales bacterium OttesenSCG-928-A19]|nr:U32 family peptidase [Eubacteriales bacterium OttesenSCG-928-A19]
MANRASGLLGMRPMMEVLAPVGGRQQLLAAVRCGADSVYLGAKGFNARRNAENFEEASLAEAVSYCHARNVRVYVTVNTLVMDDELPALMDTLREVAASGADAVIIQDLGVASLIRRHLPEIELHASTQTTLHNAAGARMAEALGFARAVLARELTLEEIHALHARSSIALEAFVHGALCVSASGACYLSAMLGGRSGNRGLCAQPCRLDFRAGTRGYALSLKDLSALGCIDAMGGAGIVSLKIEGRMKRPEYVAAAVTACRRAIAGEPYDVGTLEAVFSRGGFTNGYLMGKRDASMYGMRDASDAEASRKVYGELAALYRRERPSVAVDMTLSLAQGSPATLVVSDGERTVAATGPVPETAISAPTDEARARRSLSKTGESPFFLRTLVLNAPGDLRLPSSAMGAMRREALETLLRLRETPQPKAYIEMPDPMPPPHTPVSVPSLRLRFESPDQLRAGMDAEQVILPVRHITPEVLRAYGDRLVAEIPALVFPGEEDHMLSSLVALREKGLRGALCQNLGAIGLARDAGLATHGGYGLNILNSLALEAYAELGLVDATVSFELHARRIARLGGVIPRGAIAYGRLPLMQLRVCPVRGEQGCDGCDGRPQLSDRRGEVFPLLCQQRRFVTLLNSVPLNLSGEGLPGVDFLLLHFTTETAAECRRISEGFVNGSPPEGMRTRGLYHRTLQ